MLKNLWLNKRVVFGYFLIILGVILLIIKLLVVFKSKPHYNNGSENKINSYNSYNTVEKVIKEDNISYIAYLKIPKINLEQALIDKTSPLNYVDINIQIIKESDMPDVEGGNLILAAHSGNSNVSYFKNLNKITHGDIVYVIYNDKLYTYQVTNCYTVEKTGVVDIVRNSYITTLTLITCVENTNKQLVVICELKEINNL